MTGTDSRPIVGITLGDPVGIGPEIVVRALQNKAVFEQCKPLVIGSLGPIQQACEVFQLSNRLNVVEDPADGVYEYGTIDFIECGEPQQSLKIGAMQAEGGRAAVAYTKKVVELLLSQQVDATASGPTNKEAMHLAGYHYRGVTELFADLTSAEEVTTVLVVGSLKIFQITTHVSVRQAMEMLTHDKILSAIQTAAKVVSEAGEAHPRLAIAGLNPHAGENGLMGDEEIKTIGPAVEEARRLGIDIDGPIPADSILGRGLRGEYHGLLFLMHDQANIGVKLLADRYPPVTYSAGLPVVRTTVAHGTAFDIAFQGKADPQSMTQAILVAADIAARRKRIGVDGTVHSGH